MRVKVAALRADLARVLSSARNEPVTVTKHGNDVAVVISPEQYADYVRLRSVYTTLPKRREVRLVSCV